MSFFPPNVSRPTWRHRRAIGRPGACGEWFLRHLCWCWRVHWHETLLRRSPRWWRKSCPFDNDQLLHKYWRQKRTLLSLLLFICLSVCIFFFFFWVSAWHWDRLRQPASQPSGGKQQQLDNTHTHTHTSPTKTCEQIKGNLFLISQCCLLKRHCQSVCTHSIHCMTRPIISSSPCSLFLWLRFDFCYCYPSSLQHNRHKKTNRCQQWHLDLRIEDLAHNIGRGSRRGYPGEAMRGA